MKIARGKTKLARLAQEQRERHRHLHIANPEPPLDEALERQIAERIAAGKVKSFPPGARTTKQTKERHRLGAPIGRIAGKVT